MTGGCLLALPLQVFQVLEKWGVADKAVAFITDWGSNMISAGNILQAKLPNCVAQSHCLQHLLNNALKDFANHPGLSALVGTAKDVVNYINRHAVLRATYDKHKKALKGTALVKPVATRFGSSVAMLRSISANE